MVGQRSRDRPAEPAVPPADPDGLIELGAVIGLERAAVVAALPDAAIVLR